MKKLLALALALMMVLSLAACGGDKGDNTTAAPDAGTKEATEAAATEAAGAESTEAAEAEEIVCTPENFDKAKDNIRNRQFGDPDLTYEEVVALFGVEGTPTPDLEYEGYEYYDWTDGARKVTITFQVDGSSKIYYAWTGDFID